jgi:hypothetical protein
MTVLTISFIRNASPTLIPSEAKSPNAVKIGTLLASWTPTDPGTTKIMKPTSPENASIARLVCQSFGRAEPSEQKRYLQYSEREGEQMCCDRSREITWPRPVEVRNVLIDST